MSGNPSVVCKRQKISADLKTYQILPADRGAFAEGLLLVQYANSRQSFVTALRGRLGAK
jgi:hypothetical protein